MITVLRSLLSIHHQINSMADGAAIAYNHCTLMSDHLAEDQINPLEDWSAVERSLSNDRLEEDQIKPTEHWAADHLRNQSIIALFLVGIVINSLKELRHFKGSH